MSTQRAPVKATVGKLPLPEMEMHRAARMAKKAIIEQDLNLFGLTVYTEAATGPYASTACIAALAGAKVIALARSSKWATAEEAASRTHELAKACRVADNVSIVFEKKEEDLAQTDIVTNTGNVRPIDQATINMLQKPTVVIPLMWESFEWRPDELDLAMCRKRDILVMGTDESRLDFFPYLAETMALQLHACGISIHHARLLCLGGGIILEQTAKDLRSMGADARLYGPDSLIISGSPVPRLDSSELKSFLGTCDAVLCDERQERTLLMGEQGLISPSHLASINPSCVIINKHGIQESDDLLRSGLVCVPTTKSASWMAPNITTAVLGYRPVIELMTAGLRVGEVMARARIAGLGVSDAAKLAIQNSCAQDFPPPLNLLPPAETSA